MLPAPYPAAPTFATHLDRTERDQLDARAACAEQERDDALDDLREAKQHHTELHTRLNAAENDLRSQTRAARELQAERDQAREKTKHWYRTVETVTEERDRAREQRDRLLADLTDAGNEVDQLTVDLARTRGELGTAQELLAQLRHLDEQRDRAWAGYDTRNGEQEPAPAADEQTAVQWLLDDSTRAFAAADNSSERVEIIRDVLEGWYAAWPTTAVTDPHEGIAWHLASLINPAEAKASADLGSPADRAQDGPTAAELLRQAAAGRREYAKLMPETAEPLELQAHTLDAAARVVEGDLSPLYDWLPSWQWTDEMHARLHPEKAQG